MIRNKNSLPKTCSDVIVTGETPVAAASTSDQYTRVSLTSTVPFTQGTIKMTFTIDGNDWGSFDLSSGSNKKISNFTYTGGAVGTLTNPMNIFDDLNRPLTDAFAFFNGTEILVSKWKFLEESIGTSTGSVHTINWDIKNVCTTTTNLYNGNLWSPDGASYIRALSVFEGTRLNVYDGVSFDNINISYIMTDDNAVADLISSIDYIEVFTFNDIAGTNEIKLAELQGSDLSFKTLTYSPTNGFSFGYITDQTQFIPTHKGPKPFAGVTAAQLAWDNEPAEFTDGGNGGDVDNDIWNRYHQEFGELRHGNRMVIHYNNGRADEELKDLKYGTRITGYSWGVSNLTQIISYDNAVCGITYEGIMLYTPFSGLYVVNSATVARYSVIRGGVVLNDSGWVDVTQACGWYGAEGRVVIFASGLDWSTIKYTIPESVFTRNGNIEITTVNFKVDKDNNGTITYENDSFFETIFNPVY